MERDKLEVRLAKLSGGAAIIYAGGATPVEQKRRAQLIEDAISATRAAIRAGIVAGGGTALVQAAPELADLERELADAARRGAAVVRRALTAPARRHRRQCRLGRGDDRRPGSGGGGGHRA